MNEKRRRKEAETGWIVRSLLLFSASCSISLFGCQGPSPLPPTTVSLRMTGAPADAIVTIDDKTIGPLDYVASRGVALPPGVHHITVQAAGYFPFDQEVDAKITDPPTLIRVVAKLRPIPD